MVESSKIEIKRMQSVGVKKEQATQWGTRGELWYAPCRNLYRNCTETVRKLNKMGIIGTIHYTFIHFSTVKVILATQITVEALEPWGMY